MDHTHEEVIRLRDIILGGQDGLVNVLGLTLGLVAAHGTTRIILIAGLAAGFSEAVSMGAVAYTSATAEKTSLNNTQLIFNSFVVGLSALIGASIPLIPFLFFITSTSIALALSISAVILFSFGVSRAKNMHTNWLKSGLQILIIGMLSALAGFVIGLLLKIN